MARKKRKTDEYEDEEQTKNSDGNKAVAVGEHENSQENSQAETITSTESTKKVRGKRSVVSMAKVLMRKAKGKKTKVKTNDTGNPSGKGRPKLQSYIGMYVRNNVPINIKNWPEVKKDVKEMLWEDIESTFILPPECKKVVLASAGAKWRQFKCDLYTKHVLPHLGTKKKLRKPPKMYNFVGVRPWREFVKERSTASWQELHNAQSERVKNRTCHHKTARKGYIGLEEELRKTLPEGEVIDRAVMWKKARLLKDGSMDEELKPIAERIDDLLDKQSKGELKVSGSDDVLTLALKTREHSGRVRGVGGFVNPCQFWHMPKEKRVRVTKAELMARDRARDQELEETRQSLAEMKSQIEALMSGSGVQSPKTPISDKCSAFAATKHVLDEDELCMNDADVCHSVPSPSDSGKKCELAVDIISNIVAFGTVLDDQDDLMEGCIRVSVDGDLQGDATAPCPVDGEMLTVSETVGCHVYWPEELVVYKLHSSKPIKKEKKKKTPNVKSLFKDTILHPNVPKRCRLLYKHAKTQLVPTGETITTVLDADVFGEEKNLILLSENVTDMLEMEWIGQGVLAAYIMVLHDMLVDKDALDGFAFVHPTLTYNAEESPTFERYLVNRLKEGADRVMFLPYNPGKHWILSIVWGNDIFILDSLAKPVCYKRWENMLTAAVKTFNAETGRGTKLPKVNRLAGVPKQPGGVECGYYVMRYMRDIINDDTLSFPHKWATKCRRLQYSQEELDEVRIELADYISTLL